MDLGLSGETALVLAGSKGIGRGIAEALSAAGARVLLTSRDLAEAQSVAAEIGGNACGRACDTANEDSVAALVADVNANFGGVSILVLNSGGPPPGPAATAHIDSYRQAFEQLFTGPVTLATAFLGGMRARGYGRILTVGSSGMVEPIPNLAVSNAIRPALAGWSKTLAREVAGDGVTVNVLIPGRIATDRTAQIDATNSAKQGLTIEEVAGQARARIPVGRYGKVDEFGAVAAFLAGRQAGYITGSFIRVDGGQIASIG